MNSSDATDVTTLAEGITETTYTDKIASPDLATYCYKVAASNGDMQSEFAESADVIIGVSVKLPYENSIHSEELFDQLTVIDANNDKSTWTFDDYYEAATHKYNAENAGDDWLVSPAVNMKKNSAYKFSFDAVICCRRHTRGAAHSRLRRAHQRGSRHVYREGSWRYIQGSCEVTEQSKND